MTALPDLPGALLTELAGCGLEPAQVYADVARAVVEDLPTGVDVTTAATVPPGARGVGDLVARAGGVVAGLPVADLVLRYVAGTVAGPVAGTVVGAGTDVGVERRAADGDRVARGDVLLTVTGPTAALLTAERTALNYLCHLSGVATTTARWVGALAGTKAKVRDTRKTTPGMRSLEKYAVRCGGGVNHRAGLCDAALVKDNHVLAAGGVVPAYRAVRATFPGLPVQVEVTTVAELRAVLDAGAREVLLDNMTTEQLAEAVAANGGRAVLEASGGLTLDRAAEVAGTGVDLLAVGALTHSAPVLDVAMDLRPAEDRRERRAKAAG